MKKLLIILGCSLFGVIPIILYSYALFQMESVINAGAALGAYVGAIVAVSGALGVFYLDKKHQRDKEKSELSQLYQAINMEVVQFIRLALNARKNFDLSVENNRKENVNRFLTLQDLPFLLSLPAPIVYSASANKLGSFSEIREDFLEFIISFHVISFEVRNGIQFYVAGNPNKKIDRLDVDKLNKLIVELIKIGLAIVLEWSPESDFGKMTKDIILKRIENEISEEDLGL